MYTDIEFVTAFKNRDAKALAYVYRLEKKHLVYFADRLLDNKGEVENIAGDSFMKLWAKHADFDSLQAVKSFLYETTRESCLNFLKYSRKVSDSQMFFTPCPERDN